MQHIDGLVSVGVGRSFEAARLIDLRLRVVVTVSPRNCNAIVVGVGVPTLGPRVKRRDAVVIVDGLISRKYPIYLHLRLLAAAKLVRVEHSISYFFRCDPGS